MNDREHAEEILEAARRDLRALRAMRDVSSFPDEIFGFHTQQAIEKSLKAWLACLGVAFPKTHDLQLLIDLLKGAGVSTESMEPFVDLNAFAVQYRYETLYDDEAPLDRSEWLERVSSLIDEVAVAIQR